MEVFKTNNLAEVVRSKLGRPLHKGKSHIPPPFWAFLGVFAYLTERVELLV